MHCDVKDTNHLIAMHFDVNETNHLITMHCDVKDTNHLITYLAFLKTNHLLTMHCRKHKASHDVDDEQDRRASIAWPTYPHTHNAPPTKGSRQEVQT